jgi:hypothetical protein
MLRRLPILLVAAWGALGALGPAFAAEPVFLKGMRIGLVPPGDFKPSTHFSGFEDAGRNARVAIIELPLQDVQGVERSVFARTSSVSAM